MNNNRPVIGIPDLADKYFCGYMKRKYEKSLIRSGAFVRWIPIDCAEQAAEEAVKCDGLLLPGGADVNPALYGREKQAECGRINPHLDEVHMQVLESFVKTEKPILAICRGIQFVNVFFGGTLHQDIAAIQQVRHFDIIHRAGHAHYLSVKEESRLFSIFNKSRISVNSMHHQAVETPADVLKVCGISQDGIIEALEHCNYPFLLAVQWHPEQMSKKDSGQKRLFDVFVNECIKAKNKFITEK